MCVKKVFCFSVEPDHNRKALSRHGSVEIFDGEIWKSTQNLRYISFPGAYNLTVPSKMSRHSSTTKLEEIHSDHIKIVGELENAQEESGLVAGDKEESRSSASSSSAMSGQNKEAQIQESASVTTSSSHDYATSSMSQQSLSSSTSMTSMTSMQSMHARSEMMSETKSVSQQQSSVETLQSTFQVCLSTLTS